MNRLVAFFLLLLAWPVFGQQTVGVDQSGKLVAPPWALNSPNGIITNIIGGDSLSRSGATVTVPTNGSGGGGGGNIFGPQFGSNANGIFLAPGLVVSNIASVGGVQFFTGGNPLTGGETIFDNGNILDFVNPSGLGFILGTTPGATNGSVASGSGNFNVKVVTPVLTLSNGVAGTATNHQDSGSISILNNGTNVFKVGTNQDATFGGNVISTTSFQLPNGVGLYYNSGQPVLYDPVSFLTFSSSSIGPPDLAIKLGSVTATQQGFIGNGAGVTNVGVTNLNYSTATNGLFGLQLYDGTGTIGLLGNTNLIVDFTTNMYNWVLSNNLCLSNCFTFRMQPSANRIRYTFNVTNPTTPSLLSFAGGWGAGSYTNNGITNGMPLTFGIWTLQIYVTGTNWQNSNYSQIYLTGPGFNLGGSSTGAFIASLNGNGASTTLTNFTLSGNGTNNGIIVTNSGTNVSRFLNYTLILTNMINDPFAGNGIAWVDVGGFSWQHAGPWVLNMTGGYDLAVAGNIQQNAETGTYTVTSGSTVSITSGTFAAIRLNAGFLNDYLSLNFQNNAMAMAGVPFLYDPWSNSGGNSNQVFQFFPFGSTYSATTSCGASNYLATVCQTNSIATASGFMVYTNHNKEFVFGPGTNASKTLTYSQKGQSLDGSISYRTLTPGFIMVTNNGTSWGVATNILPVFVNKGFPTSVPTVLVSQDGIALWSTNASSTSHQCVIAGTLDLMTR